MEYNAGTEYGDDIFMVNPMLNSYDAPHMETAGMFMDKQYSVAATYQPTKKERPREPMTTYRHMVRPTKDTHSIDGALEGMATSDMFKGVADVEFIVMIFVVIILMMTIVNTMRMRALTDRFNDLSEEHYMLMMRATSP